MKLLAALLAAAVAVGAAAAAGSSPTRPGPAALLTYTGSPNFDPPNAQFLACIARSDGTHRVRIVQGAFSASAPDWNPVGTRVAFTGWNLPGPFASTDDSDIVVANARGRLLRNLTAGFSQSNFNPRWSPDGKWIAFGSSPLSLTVVPASGSAPPRVIDVPDFSGSYDWFRGGRLAVATFDGIFRVNMDGSGLAKLVASGTDPAVSPNGRKLLYVAGEENFDVFLANANGSSPRRLTKTTRDETSPAWSPDGKWIAYGQTVDPRLADPQTRIVVSRSNGKAARVVITGNRYDPYYPNFRRGTKLPGARRASC